MNAKTSGMRRAAALSLTAVLLAAAAACGGTGESSSGNAIKIFISYPADNPIADVPDAKAAAQAAVEAVNKSGGVNGRDLELVDCNNRADQAQALKCARDTTTDPDIVAAVGTVDLFTPQTLPVLNSKGIATVGGYSLGNEIDYQDSLSYPLNGGATQGYLGIPHMLAELDIDSFAVQACEYPSCTQPAADLEKYAPAANVEYLGNIEVPNAGVTDYSTYATKTKDLDAPAAVQIVSAAPMTGLAKAGSAIGFEPLYAGNEQQASETTESGAGSIEGFYASGPFPSPRNQEDPAMEQYVAERAAAEGKEPSEWLDSTVLDHGWSFAVNAWLAVHAFADSAGEVDGELTAKTYSDSLASSDKEFDLFGLTTWKPSATGPEAFPRFAAMRNYVVQVKDGKIATTDIEAYDIQSSIAP